MKPKVKQQDVINYLTNAQSIQCFENEGSRARYVVTITDDGECIDPDPRERSFSSTRCIWEHRFDEDMDGIYQTETMEDDSFREMVENILGEINEEFEVIQ